MAHRKVNKHFFIRKIVEKQFPYDYEIYVDASFRKDENNNSPFSAYSFVVTSNNTINEIFASRRLGKPGNSEKAETVGIYNVLDYIKDERTHNIEQSTIEEGKVGCIVGTYDFE